MAACEHSPSFVLPYFLHGFHILPLCMPALTGTCHVSESRLDQTQEERRGGRRQDFMMIAMSAILE